MTREEKVILTDMLASFSLGERQCYIFHFGQGMSMSAIAAEFDLKKRTVQQYIDRAKKR